MFLVILCIKLLKICNIYTAKSPDRPLSASAARATVWRQSICNHGMDLPAEPAAEGLS
jgi:hypothetical protein